MGAEGVDDVTEVARPLDQLSGDGGRAGSSLNQNNTQTSKCVLGLIGNWKKTLSK